MPIAKTGHFLLAWMIHWGAFYMVTMFIILFTVGEANIFDLLPGRTMPLYLAVMIVSPAPALFQVLMFDLMARKRAHGNN